MQRGVVSLKRGGDLCDLPVDRSRPGLVTGRNRFLLQAAET